MTKPLGQTVLLPPSGLVVAIQYWAGDERAALRLARLLAAIERQRTTPRRDATLALVRRFDCPESWQLRRTFERCARALPTLVLQSEREGVGHPDGCNALWAGTMGALARLYEAGELSRASAFTVEADGVPLRREWLDLLAAEHLRALSLGRRVTGALLDWPYRHVNGNLIAHLSLWRDRRSLHRTPPGHAWDVFHGATLVAECQSTSLIVNAYGVADLSPPMLAATSGLVAWLHGCKDDSAFDWAREHLLLDGDQR